MLSFGPNPNDSYYVPFRHRDGGNVGNRNGPQTATGWDNKLAPGEKELVQAIDEPSTLVFGHNLAFDLRFMSRVDFTLKPQFEDTIVNAPLLDELVGRYSLESCAHRAKVQHKKSAEIVTYIQSKFPEIAVKDAMGHYWRLRGDDAVAVDYARGDGTTTWQLRDVQMKDICKPGVFNGEPVPSLELVHSIESRLIPVLARMMVLGVKVDPERLEWVVKEVDRQREVLANTFPSGFNPLGPTDVQAWMEKNGCTDWPYTAPSKTFPKGKPSFVAAWLETHDAGKQIIKYRKLNNLESSFIFPLRDRHVYNGRVHTQFNQLRGDDYGTITGRLSSSEPNMQQVPKHDEDLGRLFRSAFVPDFDVWGDVDYSQLEPRLMAYYTRAAVLLKDYRTNPKADAHTSVSKAMLRADKRNWDDLTPAEQRHHRNNFGKRVNQTVITGGGKNAIVRKYKVPEGEADKMIANYHRALPELKPFQRRAATRFRQRGYMLSLLSRRMRLEDPERDYTAMNRLLQGGNADIIKLKMCEVDEYLESERKGGKRPDVDVLLNCHDALSFQFDAAARPVYDKCKEIMQDFSSDRAVIKLDLPITVDDGEGSSWAVATYGEEPIARPIERKLIGRGRKDKLIPIKDEP